MKKHIYIGFSIFTTLLSACIFPSAISLIGKNITENILKKDSEEMKAIF